MVIIQYFVKTILFVLDGKPTITKPHTNTRFFSKFLTVYTGMKQKNKPHIQNAKYIAGTFFSRSIL
jgi:hypothetical protein